ncbi:hypothetical protein [Aequorivita sp. KMM 9714]|uniref:hypothetical protein n=1 Tax=Aequorivita sp. KMM 9714 TaxID=2707173 RepID=UPI0013EAB2AD|nr:hypothetical protein [Aequorivita sp. KMM 9714]NGX83475.1 hypothetical protein [Aequorivita sp. KMM 9714]
MLNIKRGLYSLPILLFFFSLESFAQVGIGNTNPSSASLLDIGDGTDDNTKGILIPRVNLTNLNSLSPIEQNPATDQVESLLVYNTNETTGKGFYYWNGGTRWVKLIASDAPIDKWSLTGNEITDDDFLGTTNDQPLRIRTNYAERFRIPNAYQVHAMGNGTASTPFYSWASDTDIGMYRISDDILGFSTNGIQRMIILSDGRVTVNSSSVFNSTFNSFATGNRMAIAAQAVNNNAVYAETTGTGDAVLGITSSGNGVWGQSKDGIGVIGIGTISGVGVQGQSNGTGNAVQGIALFSGDGVVGESTYGNGVVGYTNGIENASGVLGWASNETAGGWFISSTSTNPPTPGTGTALIGAMGSISITPPNGSGVTANGVKTGIYASASASGTGSTNSGNAAGEFTLGTNPVGGTNTIRARAKIAGYHYGRLIGIGSNNINSYYGGYFEGGVTSPAYSYVGIKYNAGTNGDGGTNYKIIGSGIVSTLVDDSAGNKRILFAPESPEILFEDYGVGKLQNGSVYINIDPLFAKSIHVSEKHPLKVFIQLEGECNGVFVTEKTASGFLVKELNGGTSNTPFSYHIVANRADDIASDGSIASKHVGLRFPIGPSPAEMMETQAMEVKEDKVKIEKVKGKSAKSTQLDIQATEKHSNSEPQLLQEQQPANTPIKSSNTNNMQLQESK